MAFSVFMSICQQRVMSAKVCVKHCIWWSVCVGFLKIGWFPNLILHPTLVIFILLCRTNLDPYLNMKCFVAIRANLFIGVSHINALHNWPTGRLFNITFPRGFFHALTALFLLFLAFLDNQKEVEQSRLAESWSCPSVSSYLLSRVLFFYFFFFSFFFLCRSGGIEGRARLCSYNLSILCLLYFPSWLRVNGKTHCDQSHKANFMKLCRLLICKSNAKGCMYACMWVGLVVMLGGRCTKPLLLKVTETSNLECSFSLPHPFLIQRLL